MRKKTLIRMWIILVITYVMCFSDWSFAADENVKQVWTIAWTIDFIVSVLSRIRVLFAKLAWDFLTNSWIYGEKLWIDVLLWQYRNIVKNMANFCLWFYLVYVIFKWLIDQWKNDVMKNLKSVLLRVLVAWVWVQASRFLTSLVIDLSTITLAAVWAFPSQIVSNNENVKDAIKSSMLKNGTTKIATGQLYELFPKDGSANSFVRTIRLSLNGEITEERFFDSLMPNDTDVAWPLYYLWFSILKVNEINSVASRSDASLKKSILNLIIQWWTTVVYSIEMAVLCVIALMRILYMWMFIVLSPLAILLACIWKAWEKDLLKKWFIADLMKQINLKTFLAKAFQPAIIVLWISLCVIFVSLINKVVNIDSTRKMDKFDIGWAIISTTQDTKTSTSDDVTYTTKVEWNLLDFSVSHLWKWILDFMLSIITVILVYVIINMGIKIWNKLWGWQDFLSKKIESVQKWVEWAISSVPLVPVAWYDKEWVPTTHHISVGKTFGLWGNDSLITEWMRRVSWKIKDEYDTQNKIIDSWFWEWNIVSFKSTDQRKVENSVSSMPRSKWLKILETQFQQIVDIGKRSKEDGGLNSGEWYGMVLNPTASNKWWQGRFEDWLKNMKGNEAYISGEDELVWKKMVKWWSDNDAKPGQTLENLFTDSTDGRNFIKAYAKLFKLGDDITNWNELKNADISMKK